MSEMQVPSEMQEVTKAEPEAQPVRYLAVAGQRVPVYLEPGLRLMAQIGGDRYRADSRAELEAELTKVLKRVNAECAIPVVIRHEHILKRAILRRAHASKRNTFLFRDYGAIEHPEIVCVGSAVTDDEISHFNALALAAKDAQAAARAAMFALENKLGGGNRWDHRAPSATTLLDEAMKAGAK